MSTKLDDLLHQYTCDLIAEMWGYAPEEVERWIDKKNDDYQEHIAEEYVIITGKLINFLGEAVQIKQEA